MKTFETLVAVIDYSNKNPSETVEYKDYFNNGQLSVHRFYVDGKRHGESKTYFTDGKLSSHYFYVGGKRHGEYKSYHENGQLCEHSFYVAGELHGESKSYYYGGQHWKHYFYVDGKICNVEHLKDGSYKSLCIKHTLFNGNAIDEDI